MTQKCFICNSKQRLFFKEKPFIYYRCSNCHLVSTLPLPTSQQIKLNYERNYNFGNYMLARKFAYDYLNNYKDMAGKLEKEMFSNGKNLRGARILDVGCFTGDFLAILEKKGAIVYGVELQKKAAEIAREKFDSRIIHEDITKLKKVFKNNSFDCVTMLGLIEHVTEPEKVFIRISALLKPGGLLMIQTPNSDSLIAFLTNKYWPPYTPIEHIYLFSNKSLHIEMGKFGFGKFITKRHWKIMPFSYLYQILGTFGPDWKKAIKPFYSLLPNFLKDLPVPFYVGEFLFFAVKK